MGWLFYGMTLYAFDDATADRMQRLMVKGDEGVRKRVPGFTRLYRNREPTPLRLRRGRIRKSKCKLWRNISVACEVDFCIDYVV